MESDTTHPTDVVDSQRVLDVVSYLDPSNSQDFFDPCVIEQAYASVISGETSPLLENLRHPETVQAYIRSVVNLDRQLVSWGNTVFNHTLERGQPPDQIPSALTPVFSDIDGFTFYAFLDTLHDRVLASCGVDDDTRAAIIGASHFGREYLDIHRKDKTEIVLVNLTNEKAIKDTGLEPLGIETIAGHLYGKCGTAVHITVYDTQTRPLEEIIHVLKHANADVVGLSVNMGGIRDANLVLDALEGLDKKPIIMSGARAAEFYPHTIGPRKNLEQFIAPGWGEIAAEDIVGYARHQKQLSELRNVSYYSAPQSDAWDKTVADMNLVVVPLGNSHPALRRELALYARFGGVTEERIRGCAASCKFCPRPTSADTIMQYPLEFKLQELMYLSAMGVKGLPFVDEEFFNGKREIPETIAFVRQIAEYKARGWIAEDIKFCADMRADTIAKADELFREDTDGKLFGGEHPFDIMKRAGFAFVFCGVEVLSQAALNHLSKGTKLKHNIQAILLLREHGIAFQAGSLTLVPKMPLSWLEETLINTRKYEVSEFANIALQLILFVNSPYFVQYFTGEEGKKNRHLLIHDGPIDAHVLDSSSGMPYHFEDARVEKVAEMSRYYDQEMFKIMKILRSINAKLIYGGQENMELHKHIWNWLAYGRMEIVLFGMERLVEAVKPMYWWEKIDQKVELITQELQERHRVLLVGLKESLTTIESTLSDDQRQLATIDDLKVLVDTELERLDMPDILSFIGPENIDIYDAMCLEHVTRQHDAWRVRTARTKNKRVATTVDSDWIDAHGANDQFDLLAYSYKQLPKDWQIKNLENSKVVVGEVWEAYKYGLPLASETVRERIVRIINYRWYVRNSQTLLEDSWAYSNMAYNRQLHNFDELDIATAIFSSYVISSQELPLDVPRIDGDLA